jgi:protein involved in temperature-dependent protein secretion
MRHTVIVARLAASALVAVAVAGCGNTSDVCADTRKTIESFAAKAKTLPPDAAAQWQQAIIDVASRLDALARRADDTELRNALKDTATSYRKAATAVGGGDTSQLTAVIRDQPRRLGKVCD